METLLTNDQKQIFKKFSEAESFGENTKELEYINSDPDYLLHHERVSSNLCRLVTPTDDQFESIKDFLAMDAKEIIKNFTERQELKYAHIFSRADILATDWVYFPQSSMRRELLKLWRGILGCELNFVLCLTAAQRQQLTL